MLDGGCGRVVEIFIKTKITGAHQKKESQRTPFTVFYGMLPTFLNDRKRR